MKTTVPSLLLCLSFGFGHFFVHWSEGLNFGFWSFVGANLLVGTAYLCLYMGLAEMIGVMPFSGGSFGFTRVTLSPFLGMLSGFDEGADYLCQTAFLLWNISELFVSVGMRNDLQPLIWFSIVIIVFLANGLMWSQFSPVYTIFPVYCIIIISIYLLGNAPSMELSRFISIYEGGNDTSATFFRCMPFTTIFYVGLEAIPLWCKDIEKPALHVPRAMVICTVTIFLLSFPVIFGVASTPPGVSTSLQQMFPLTAGLMRVFHLSQSAALQFTTVGLITALLPFFHAMAKQLGAMLRSKIIITPFMSLSSFFTTHDIDHNKEIVALLAFVRVFTLIVLVLWFASQRYMSVLYSIGLLTSISAHLCTFLNFILFRWKYGQLKRNFVNPFGIYGAVYGMMVFTLLFVSTAFLQDDNFVAFYVFMAWNTVVIGAYIFHWRFRQIYSAEESAILFLAHVMKANEKRRSLIKSAAKKLRRKGHKASPENSTLRRWFEVTSYRKSDRSGNRAAAVVPVTGEDEQKVTESQPKSNKGSADDQRRAGGGSGGASKKGGCKDDHQREEDSCVRLVSRRDVVERDSANNHSVAFVSTGVTADPINPFQPDQYIPMPTSTTPTKQSPSSSRRIVPPSGSNSTPGESSDDDSLPQGRRLVDQIYRFFDVTQVLTEKEAIAQYRENYGSALMSFPAAVHNVYSVEDAASVISEGQQLSRHQHQQQRASDRNCVTSEEDTFYDLLDADEIIDSVFNPQSAEISNSAAYRHFNVSSEH